MRTSAMHLHTVLHRAGRLTSQMLLVALLISFWAGIANSQGMPFRRSTSGTMTGVYERLYTEKLDKQISLMKVAMNLNDRQVQAIRVASIEPIRKAAARAASAMENGKRESATLPKEISDPVMATAERVGGPAAILRWRRDITDREEYKRNVSREGFLIAIDQTLMLTKQQRKEFDQLLRRHWKDSWSYLGLSTGPTGLLILREALNELPQSGIRKTLSPAQWKAYSGADTAPYSLLMSASEGKELERLKKEYAANQREHCQNIAVVKLEQLYSRFRLDTPQREKIAEAMERVVDRIVARQVNAYVKLKTIGPGRTDAKSMSHLMDHLADQIDESPAWKRVLADNLTLNGVETWRVLSGCSGIGANDTRSTQC